MNREEAVQEFWRNLGNTDGYVLGAYRISFEAGWDAALESLKAEEGSEPSTATMERVDAYLEAEERIAWSEFSRATNARGYSLDRFLTRGTLDYYEGLWRYYGEGRQTIEREKLKQQLAAEANPIGEMARYKHDCKECLFLGRWGDRDLYFCRQGANLPTVIARFGDYGSDYTSGLNSFAPSLIEAEKRARERGLLVDAAL